MEEERPLPEVKRATYIPGVGDIFEAIGFFYDCTKAFQEKGLSRLTMRELMRCQVKTGWDNDIAAIFTGDAVAEACLYVPKYIAGETSRVIVRDSPLIGKPLVTDLSHNLPIDRDYAREAVLKAKRGESGYYLLPKGQIGRIRVKDLPDSELICWLAGYSLAKEYQYHLRFKNRKHLSVSFDSDDEIEDAGHLQTVKNPYAAQLVLHNTAPVIPWISADHRDLLNIFGSQLGVKRPDEQDPAQDFLFRLPSRKA